MLKFGDNVKVPGGENGKVVMVEGNQVYINVMRFIYGGMNTCGGWYKVEEILEACEIKL